MKMKHKVLKTFPVSEIVNLPIEAWLEFSYLRRLYGPDLKIKYSACKDSVEIYVLLEETKQEDKLKQYHELRLEFDNKYRKVWELKKAEENLKLDSIGEAAVKFAKEWEDEQ